MGGREASGKPVGGSESCRSSVNGGDGPGDGGSSDEKQMDPECILKISQTEPAIGLDMRGQRGGRGDQ